MQGEDYSRWDRTNYCVGCKQMADTISELRAENQRLRQATERLATFAGHDDGCQTMLGSWGQVEACSCGYTEAWQAWRALIPDAQN